MRFGVYMKYYKYYDEYSQIAGGITYVEVTDNFESQRQITVKGNRFLASNIYDSEFGICLGENGCDYDNDLIDEVTEIDKQDFENIWQEYLEKHSYQWNSIKKNYTLGTYIEGHVLIFYPQGILILINNMIIGLIKRSKYNTTTMPHWLDTGHKITAFIYSYDELNHWLILEDPRLIL